MNAHDAIIDAVLDLLQQAPAVTTGTIGEDVEVETLPESTIEAVCVSIVGSDPEAPAPLLGAPVDWTTTVQIECYARRDGRGTAGRASRALHARVYQRLMAGNPLGQVIPGADLRQPSIRTDQQVLETRTGVTVGLYPVSHRTGNNTLDTFGN